MFPFTKNMYHPYIGNKGTLEESQIYLLSGCKLNKINDDVQKCDKNKINASSRETTMKEGRKKNISHRNFFT